MPRQAAAPKAKEALTTTSKSERPQTPETADTNEEVRRAEATEPESDLEADKKQRRALAPAPKRSRSAAGAAATKEKSKPKKAASKEATMPVESAEGTEDEAEHTQPTLPTTKAKAGGTKKEEKGKKDDPEGTKKGSQEAQDTKSRKRQADLEGNGPVTKPTKKRRGSDADGDASAKAAPKDNELDAAGAVVAKAAGKGKKGKAAEPEEPPVTEATTKKAKSKQKATADVPPKDQDTSSNAPKPTKKTVQSKGSAAEAAEPTKQPKKTNRKASVNSVEGADEAPTSEKAKLEQDGPVAAKSRKGARKGSAASSVEVENVAKEESKKSTTNKSTVRKDNMTSAEGAVPPPPKAEPVKRKGSAASVEESESGPKKAVKKKTSATKSEEATTKRRQSLEPIDEEAATAAGATKRKRAQPTKEPKDSEEKSVETNPPTEEPAQKKKRAVKKGEEDEVKAAAGGEKKTKKRPNQESSPAAKKAKYDPHVDGKGPLLDDKWEEQLKEVPGVEGELKIATWNVNGLRSVLKKPKNPTEEYEGDLQAYLAVEAPDILCLNEVKADDEVFSSLLEHFPEYHAELVHSEKKGYAGVAILVRKRDNLHEKIEEKIEGIGEEEHDSEGRTLTLVFPGCCVVASYVANAGQGLKRLDYRIDKYDKALHAFLNGLRQKYDRPVIWCGDLNVAYEEIDIWDSKHNLKSAGHTPQERASFGSFLEDGTWVDIWRKQNPNTRRYTFWPSRSTRSRVDNLGWRLDYFIITKDLEDFITGAHIRDKFKGSDHCPILLTVKRTALFD